MGTHASLQTLLVGIDAACHRVLQPMFENGELPTLESLFTDGAAGPLESQIPPWTASAWPSLYTGMNPGKHGVYSFLSFEGYEWDVVNATDVRERPLWELLDRHGLTSVVVNVPVTHPPREFDGALIPGYTAPENPECHPGGLLEEVRAEIGEYRVYPDSDADGGLVEAYTDCARMRGEAFRYLCGEFDPDFGFLEFQVTDSIFHKRPDDEAAIRSIYREVDRQLESTISKFDPDTVVVASDHGMGPYDGYECRVNDVLREQGYVEIDSGGRGMPNWATVREQNLKQGRAETARNRSGLEQFVGALARVGVTSQRIERGLEWVGLADFVARHTPDELASAGATHVDFPRSRAYMRSRIELGVRINLEGRDPEGVVPPEEYESVRADLIDELRSVRTPSGDPVFEAVLPREECFHGPEVDDAVDIVTIPAEFDHFLSATLRDEPFGPPSEPWNHKLEGVVAVAGTGVTPSRGVGNAHVFDVAPTVLATLDVPVDARMDGRALPCVESSGVHQYPRLEPGRELLTADETVENRLAELGYLE